MKQIKSRKLHLNLVESKANSTSEALSVDNENSNKDINTRINSQPHDNEHYQNNNLAENNDSNINKNDSNINKDETNFTNNNCKEQKINVPAFVILIIIISLISGSLGAYAIILTNSNKVTPNSGIVKGNAILNETNSIANAVEKVYDAVVVVEVYSDKDELVSTGTGFVYKKNNKKAYLMTNNHVISAGKKVKVLFTDGTEEEATIVGSDTYSDIAVLTINDTSKIVSATIGKSTASKVGDTVFTVGSPEGSDYAGTVTKGILSANERLVAVALENNQTSDYYMQVLQTDAAINPGNSGGPLCNINGEVIGITNMKLVDDTVEGMGFAIPVEEALKVAEILEKDGKITRPKLGISVATINNKIELYYQSGILVPNDINEGIVIVSVEKDTPAEAGGLAKGDIIIKLANTKVSTLADFRYELYKHDIGEEIEVTYIRDEKVAKTTIKLG